ncbi:MAG: hypothetical protein WCJ39_08570, partial [bacterium]
MDAALHPFYVRHFNRFDCGVSSDMPAAFEPKYPEKDFTSYKYTQEHPGSFYTITDVNVMKVLKGDYRSKNMALLQSAAVLNSPRWGATFWNRVLFITGELNTVLRKNSTYLLFLKKTDLGEV